MDSGGDLDLLISTPAFGGVDRPEAARLARRWDACDVKVGEVLVADGVAPAQVFVVIDGWASVSSNGRIIAVLGRGGTIGNPHGADRAPAPATIAAMTTMRVWASPPNWRGLVRAAPPDRGAPCRGGPSSRPWTA
jgi:CRP-like cAMP-binding protein